MTGCLLLVHCTCRLPDEALVKNYTLLSLLLFETGIFFFLAVM